MRTQNILLLSAAALMLLSCVKEPHEQLGGGFGDGTATRITISLKSDKQPGAAPAISPAGTLRAWSPSGIAAMGTLPASRALTTEQEQLISNLHILIFDAGGAIVVNEHFENLNITEVGSVPLETLPGADMQIWAVANGDVNDDTGYKLDDHLKTVTTLDELKALMVNVKGNGLNRADRLTMVGNTTVTITKPHKTAISIQMHFLSAKVTLTIKNNIPEGQAITITGWDMVNIPKKTYLRERTDPNEDAVTSSDYITTNGKYEFDIKGDVTGTWSQEFYLFENRRGGRVPRTDPSGDTYPDMGIDDNDQRGKAYYAPVGATYMLIYGTYTKEGRMNNVVYKIFFGENEINDYNIHRGKHYKYNVTINGLNDINIDSNVEWGSASFSVATSDNLMMDAHPDFRVLRIGGTAVDIATPAYATVEVLESNGTSPCTWLALSPLNLYRHGIKQATGDHQQFGVAEGAGSYVRSKYTAAPTTESTLVDATFAMTRKLTRIPFNQPAVYTYQNVIVYADTYEGTADRTAKVCVTYYRGADGTQEAGKLTYDITQSGAIRISDDLYMERYEESAMLLHPGLASGFQNTTTMQWGYNTATLYAEDDRFSNGGYLTANAVYNNVGARNGMIPPVWTANAYTDYRDKFPRQGGKVEEPSSLPVSDDVYFYPEQNASTPLTAYFHPIFNSSAARYCHEKNRDTDGDGVISSAETVWYLPSFADMWYISKNMPSGTTLSGTYWTASEESNTNSWAYTFPATGPASTAKGTSARVRCVRGNGAVLPDAKMESTEADKTKINLAATAGAAGAFNITDATGLPWIVSVSEDATSWLKIATSANGTGAAATATGNGNKTLYAYATTENTSTTSTRIGTITISRIGLSTINSTTITVVQGRIIGAATVIPTELILAYSAGGSSVFNIDNKSAGIEWTVTVSNEAKSWLTIATDESGSDVSTSRNGKDNAKFFAYAQTENETLTDWRYGEITFSRPDMAPIKINVKQSPMKYIPTPTTGWAGSNIFWEPEYENDDGTKGRLTFMNTGDKSMELVTGVFFRWGSLVAISPGGRSFTTETVLFDPMGRSYAAMSEIPCIDEVFDGYEIDADEDLVTARHDPSGSIGDICKYISDRGWAPDSEKGVTWRMPTSIDFDGTERYTGAPRNSFGSMPTSTDNRDGLVKVQGYIQLPLDATRTIKLPCAGCRSNSGMLVNSQGNTEDNLDFALYRLASVWWKRFPYRRSLQPPQGYLTWGRPLANAGIYTTCHPTSASPPQKFRHDYNYAIGGASWVNPATPIRCVRR